MTVAVAEEAADGSCDNVEAMDSSNGIGDTDGSCVRRRHGRRKLLKCMSIVEESVVLSLDGRSICPRRQKEATDEG